MNKKEFKRQHRIVRTAISCIRHPSSLGNYRHKIDAKDDAWDLIYAVYQKAEKQYRLAYECIGNNRFDFFTALSPKECKARGMKSLKCNLQLNSSYPRKDVKCSGLKAILSK